MYKNKRVFNHRGILLLCYLILITLILQSCFGTSKHRSGKLSDAMEEASDKHKGERKVETEPDYDDDESEYEVEETGLAAALVEDDSSIVGDSQPPEATFLIEGRRETWFSIAGGTGLLKRDDFYGLNHGNLAIGTFVAEKHYFELATGAAWAPVQKTSMFNESIDGGVVLLQINGCYKYHFTPRHTFLGLYAIAGLGYAYMRWTYKHPFEAMAYDEEGYELGMETISGDGLSGFEIFTGLGINLIQTESFQLGTELLPGAIFWGGETSEGFDNDVFNDFYYTKLRIALRFGW